MYKHIRFTFLPAFVFVCVVYLYEAFNNMYADIFVFYTTTKRDSMISLSLGEISPLPYTPCKFSVTFYLVHGR